MFNLSYRYDQNSTSLTVVGVPDITAGDSEQTIGILSSWKLEIIGFPLLEGKREHLDNLMQGVLKYSRYCISGIREKFISPHETVVISPLGINHKLLLISSQVGIKPLEIILDDSELSDLTRCLDALRFDDRINLNWTFKSDKPLRKGFIFNKLSKSSNYLPILYSTAIFLLISGLFLLVPTEQIEYKLEQENPNTLLFND